jgi:hypothetical protein
MDTLAKEEALLSVSRSAAMPTGDKPTGDTSDNLDAIRKVDHQVDDGAMAPQVGAHGLYNFSMHVLTLPPICVSETAREKSQDLVFPEDGRKAESKNGSKVSLGLSLDELQKWLAPPPVSLTTHGAVHPGTGKWFIQGKTFRWWKKEGGASLLVRGECMFLSPAVPSRLLITSFFSQPGPERLSFGMQFPERSVH